MSEDIHADVFFVLKEKSMNAFAKMAPMCSTVPWSYTMGWGLNRGWVCVWGRGNISIPSHNLVHSFLFSLFCFFSYSHYTWLLPCYLPYFFPKHCWWLRESCALQLCHQGRPSEDRLWRGFPSPRYPPNGDKPSSCIVTSQKDWHNRSLSSIYPVPRLSSPVPHSNTPSISNTCTPNQCLLYSIFTGHWLLLL